MPDVPIAKVELALSTNPTAPPTWIDVSQWVQSFSINRGRQRELNSIQTGTAQILLDNRDRRFDPANTSSPYYPNILPMRRIRISAVWNGVAIPQFTGYVESWLQTYSGWADANVPLTASDGFKVLNLAQLNTTFNQERSNIRIGNVLTTIGWTVGGAQWTLGDPVLGILGSTTVLGPTGDRSLGVGLMQIQTSILSKTSALAHMQDVTTTENGVLFMNKTGQVQFIGRAASPSPSLATFGEQELLYTGLTFQFDDNLIFNDVRMTRLGGVEQVASDAPSQVNYFMRTISFSNTLHVIDNNAQSMASYLLNRYKQPFLEVVGMQLDGTADPSNLWPQILGREIGDVITVRRRPPGGGQPIEQVSAIQGISMAYSAQNNDWLAAWWLNATDQTRYWILGDPVMGLLGTTSQLFY